MRRPLPLLLVPALALLAACATAPATEVGAGRSQPTSVAAAGPKRAMVATSTDWRALLTGDHSRRQPIGCVRDLMILSTRLDADLEVTGPDGRESRCAAVVASVSWTGSGPIGLLAYVSPESRRRVQAAVLLDRTRTVRLGLEIWSWDEDHGSWFASLRTPRVLAGTIDGPPDQPVLRVDETSTRAGLDARTEVHELYVEVSPTRDPQVVVVATAPGRTTERPFQR